MLFGIHVFIKKVKSRGVEDVGSSTVTSKLGGCFKSDPAVRAEFMNLVNKA
jgi:GTP cyclohydrolase I